MSSGVLSHAQELAGEQQGVRGVRYVYMAYSSVFPTYGPSNRARTVVARPLRPADHLKKQLAS